MIRAALLLSAFATPAAAAGDSFFSLTNTDFIVLLAFILFLGVLVYFKVPGIVGGMLDRRAEGIQNELDEARKLKEDAQALLASYERKQREVQAQADRIVEQAKREAQANADEAKKDLERSIARRLQAAEDQIAQAEADAVKEIRNRAIVVATEAARRVVAEKMTPEAASETIDRSIDQVAAKLH
jgi:F-type H+-transporting ATPase subunit b